MTSSTAAFSSPARVIENTMSPKPSWMSATLACTVPSSQLWEKPTAGTPSITTSRRFCGSVQLLAPRRGLHEVCEKRLQVVGGRRPDHERAIGRGRTPRRGTGPPCRCHGLRPRLAWRRPTTPPPHPPAGVARSGSASTRTSPALPSLRPPSTAPRTSTSPPYCWDSLQTSPPYCWDSSQTSPPARRRRTQPAARQRAMPRRTPSAPWRRD